MAWRSRSAAAGGPLRRRRGDSCRFAAGVAGHRLAFKVSNTTGGTIAASPGGVVTLLTGEGGSRVLLPVVDEQ